MTRTSLLLFIIAATMILLSMQSLSALQEKKSLLCHRWRQFGYKSPSDTSIRKIGETMAKVIDFRENGHYSEEMFALKGSGRWRFNKDLNKVGFVFYIYNGITMRDTTIVPNQMITKLTRDTLILSFETYDGKEKKYGYEDWFYTRVK